MIIPNWNGADRLQTCLDSVLAQTYHDFVVVVVDNGSHDDSRRIIESYMQSHKHVTAIWRDKNYGYTGGVNPGFELAIELGCMYAAPFNNDAVADTQWLSHLVTFLDKHHEYGIVTSKILHSNGKTFDSTGDFYTNWGLTYPRGRDEPTSSVYDKATEIFAASGGASMYRTAMLQVIGLLDDDFFAYYEDVDLSFRAQLAGWKVAFEPRAIVYHDQGSTAKTMVSGFTTYQTMKNLPLLAYKNVPRRYLWSVIWRLTLARTLFAARAFTRGAGWMAVRGDWEATRLLPVKHRERKRIQAAKTVSDDYIWSIMLHDLPPNAALLRKLRAMWWRLRGKHA